MELGYGRHEVFILFMSYLVQHTLHHSLDSNVNKLENKLELGKMKHSSAMTLLIENQNIVMIHFFFLVNKE